MNQPRSNRAGQLIPMLRLLEFPPTTWTDALGEVSSGVIVTGDARACGVGGSRKDGGPLNPAAGAESFAL